MNILGIALEKMRNDQYYQFLSDISTTVGGNNPTTLMVTPFWNSLNGELIVLDQLYKVEQGSELTADIDAADKRRDGAFSGINFVVTGYTFHNNANTARAALLLRNSIDKYGSGITSQSLIAETSIITNLVGDWKENAKLHEAITLFNLQEWADELDAANKELNALYIRRNQETATVSQSLGDRRASVSNDVYYKLRSKLQSFGDVNDFAEPWAKTINEWNNLIESYNQLLTNNTLKTPPPPGGPTETGDNAPTDES